MPITFSRLRPALLPTLALSAIAFIVAAPAAAQEPERGDTARITNRIDLQSADHSLVTRQGDVALLLLGDELLIQLTDRGLRDMDEPEEVEESLGQRLIGTMIRAGVRTLMDNALAYPIVEIGRSEHADGRLTIEDHDGNLLFDITVNDRDIMTDFRDRDARRFARVLRERLPLHE